MNGTSKWMVKLAILLTSIALATPALAGVVMFKGKIRTGFGTSTNAGDAANNGLPACAPLNGNIYGDNDWGTMEAQGFAEQGTGTHPTLMIKRYAPLLSTGAGTNLIGVVGGNGGAFPRYASTCQVYFPPFVIRLLRSRIQAAGAGWPGADGTWGQGLGYDFTGAAANQTVPFFGTSATNKGTMAVTKGVRNFGGAVPGVTKGSIIWKNATTLNQAGPIAGGSGVKSGPGVVLGVNVAPWTNGTGMDLMTYGILPYVAGYLPTGPNALGGGTGTWRSSSDPQRLKEFGAQSSHTAKTATGNPFVFRTPGPASGLAHGTTVILTVPTPGGGTAMVPAFSPIQIRIAAGELTTGHVTRTDMVGDYTTIRGATGGDSTGLAGMPAGTTRKLQMVTPWSANIGGIGYFGLFPLPLGFGGVQLIDLDIIPVPVPEPGVLLSLGAGAIAMLGMARARRR